MSLLRVGLRICIALVLTAWSGTQNRSSGAAVHEDYVKATMLLQVARFVQWEPGQQDRPLHVCIFGSQRFLEVFESVSRNETVDGRVVEASKAVRMGDLIGCDLTYVAAASDRDLQSILERSPSGGMLVVSGIHGFAERGGAIGLVEQGGRITIEVNREAAERAGLKFSSKLLRLARIVRTRGAV